MARERMAAEKMAKEKFTENEIKLIRRCQENIPVSPDPFGDIARELGVDEEWMYETLKRWKQDKKLRRFTTILYHQNAGYDANGMSVWQVPEHRIKEIGTKMARFPEISHCYFRPELPNWPYNIYGMLHGRSRDEVEQIAKKISEQIGISDYSILFSIREFKKTSMKYFVPEIED